MGWNSWDITEAGAETCEHAWDRETVDRVVVEWCECGAERQRAEEPEEWWERLGER